MILDQIPLDKSHHAIGGAIIAAICACAAILLNRTEFAWQVALIVPAIGGIAKELWDYGQNLKAQAPVHGVEFMDALATFLGGVPVALPLMIR